MASLGEEAASLIRSSLSETTINASDDQIYTEPLETLDATQIAICIVAFFRSQGFDVSEIISVINLAAELHAPDLRYGEVGGKQAYIIHPLRNTLRLIRFGVKDLSLLMASVLHDTVEDHPFELASKANVRTEDEFEARRASLKYLASLFGEKTALVVEGVSNPIVPAEKKAAMTRGEWNVIYARHVEDSTKDPMVYACKVSDFIDNTGGSLFDGGLAPERGLRMAKKYFPVCQILLDRLERGLDEGNLPVSVSGIDQIKRSLELAQARLATVLEGAS